MLFFLWQDVGKESSFFYWAMFFFVSMTVTVGFGPVDGGFLTGPKSKLETTTNHETNHETNHVWNRMLFFLWQDVGKESSFFDWAMHFFCEHDGDGGVWAC